jgi:16S rRNA (guanine(527)-N(7))-methyltransferase RsmG
MLAEGEAQSPEFFGRLLRKRAPAFDLALPDDVRERLSRFLAELDLARRQTNLTGPVTAEELVDHVLESAYGEKLIPHGARVIDIGSGAGFPGIPLAVLRPDILVTPVEPRRKRREFLLEASERVGIANLAPPEKTLGSLSSDVANVATARAVGSVERLLGKARFLQPGGLFLAWTTDARLLSRRLLPVFALEGELPVPESRRKTIASFRKQSVPRGTRQEHLDRG